MQKLIVFLIICLGAYGQVSGPGSSTVNHLACWANTGGTLLNDCTATSTAGAVTGISFTGTGSGASYLELPQTTAPSAGTTSVRLHAPTSVTSYTLVLPSASSTGFLFGTNSSNVNTASFVAAITSSYLNITTTTCTNQFLSAISATVTGTCRSIVNADITNSTIDLTAKVTGVLPNANTTAASANTASAIVTRDGSGNFAAGTITAALTGTASGNLVSGGNAGTPSGLICTNCTGLPIAGITGLGTGVATALATNVSGSGAICLASGSACSGGGTPGGSNTQVQYNNSSAFGGISGATTDGTTLTLVAPVLGAATATSINKVTITAPTTSATLTLVTGSSLITSGANAITLTSTGTTNVTLPTAGTLAILGANTFTGLQTITQASANAGIIASTGYSLTGSNATNMIDLAGTWNTSGAPTAISLNMTNTASGAAALLIDLQVGGVSQFKVSKGGIVTSTFSGQLSAGAGATVAVSEISLQSTNKIAWYSGNVFTTADTGLIRVSAGVLSLNDGSTTTTNYRDLRVRDVFTNDASFLIRTLTTITGGSTANVPTLTTGPVTGNPTKWIPIDDNGTTRYIPAW